MNEETNAVAPPASCSIADDADDVRADIVSAQLARSLVNVLKAFRQFRS